MKTKNSNLINSELMTYHSRAKYVLLFMMLIGWTIGCVTTFPVQADTDTERTINFRGMLLPPTCVLSVNGSSFAGFYNDDFAPVYASELRNSKYIARDPVELNFMFSDCDLGESKPAFYIWSDVPAITDRELFMPDDSDVVNNSTKGVGVRLFDEGTSKFVEVRKGTDPYRVDLSDSVKGNGGKLEGTMRRFRAYVGGLGDTNNPVTCKTENNDTNVLCGGVADVKIHFEFVYQ
ncbi:fimbrial protein [Photorhabdus sp. RM71S]|uniref:fimbrial protein n=1 Tax=Photorhabdus sp. RM71S TaxID=3342824 RepID=UPI0036DC59A2